MTKEDLAAIGALLDEKLRPIEERLTALEERVTALEERMSALEMHVSNVEISLENETNRHIRLIAENHIDLNRKLNEAIRVQDNSMMLEVEMSGYKSRLDRMERELHELKEKIA